MLMGFNIFPNTVMFPYLHICCQTPRNTSNLWQLLGRGVFTTKEFQQGDFLLTYNGELIDEEEGCKRETHYPAEAGSFLFFFNHKGKNLW